MYNKYALGNEITLLEDTKANIDSILKGKRDALAKMQQGGLSDDVFLNKTIQDYIKEFKGNCFGYIGSERTKNLDRSVEFRWKGSKTELAQFLCSRASRNFVDEKVRSGELLQQYHDKFISDNS